MKRRRPQWPSVCTLLTLFISGTAMLVNPCASQEVNSFAVRRAQEYDERTEPVEQTIVLPCFPPNDEDVTSAPSSPPPTPPILNPTMWPTQTPIAPNPTEWPTQMLTTTNPTEWPTIAATPSPTIWPTVAPTPSPTMWPTAATTLSPTMWPTAAETPSPTKWPTRAPVTQTPAPVTPEPSTAPTTTPTVSPTTSPTTLPTKSTPVPTSSPTNEQMMPTFPVILKPPDSSLVETSLQPFVFTLYIAEAQAAAGSDDPDVITAEVEQILSEFLFEKLSEYDYGDGISINGIDLNLTPQSRRTLRYNIFEPSLRSLQTETLSFDVTGMATFEVAQGLGVTQQGLTNGVNLATNQIMEDPDNQDELVQEFQASDSEVLSQTVGVSAQVQEPNDGEIGKPSLVSIIFGFVIAGLGAVGAGIYVYAFIKKRRKRALQRKRERQGQYEGYRAAVNTTQSTMSANLSLPSPVPKVMARPPPQSEDESSASSSASYEGVTSEESSGSVSDFTRELELAASLDRRAWIDMQRQREALEQNSSALGKSMQYPSQYAVESPDDKGVKVRNVSGGGKQAPNISFPYGDEDDNDDSDSVDLSEGKGSKAGDLFSEGDEGVEWTEEGVWNPYDGYGNQTDRSAVESSTDTAPGSRDRNQRGSNAHMKSYSSIDTENRQRKKRDSNAYMKSWSSIDTARRDSSNTFGEDQETDQAREALLGVSADGAQSISTPGTPRMSPTASSAGIFNAVRMSSKGSAATDMAAEQTSEPSQVKAEEVSKEAENSLLTVDIVKEVQRLARFVKRYERRSQKKQQKELERNSQVASTNEVRSVPSVGYDALSDSISALRKGQPEASPRGQKEALSNAVEVPDETETSLTTDRSWSTESRENSNFEDDDDEFSIPVDESEVDISDSSVGEDVSDAASDESRLGITPFSMQKVVVPQKPSPPETSRPPITGQKGNAKGLSPVPGTPTSPDEVSPEKTHTPVQNIKQVMRRVSSARQRKSAGKSPQAPTPAKRPRESDLTEDALREISGEGGPRDVPSPYQEKGGLQSLRKNDAILDTASSIVTDGVTPSQHERAFHVDEGASQGRPIHVSQRFQANAHGKMQQRAPRDPTPTKPIEGRSQPRQQTPPQQRAVEMQSLPLQPTLPLHGQDSAEPIAPRVASEMHSPLVQRTSPSKSPGISRPTTPTGRLSPFISPFAKPPENAEATRPKSDTGRRSPYTLPYGKPLERTQQPESMNSFEGPRETRNPPAAPLEDAATRATPTMRSPPAPAKQMEQDAPPMKAQEMAPTFSSSVVRSPPRRKAKKNSAFSSIVNMFESKPKEAIFPPNESWQYNY